ncbi:hypothetical protein NBO_10g0067 [Nosema bombycis CQ1]|uniref:Uncharacterized protein n=1 Tax=Nosema bombycis (strain CQ1 / CVCC 102059) TaxID=578461 RepID=R0KXY5_NOSB1|nr:hypothetical protein NBO_10g0067 [Nosema bombycis CQ1]|eukprot:EOB15077.1 hypothetical protein NBO_10g0067 [Nosema bombycis CQ1]
MYRTSDPLKFIEEVKKEELLKIYVQSDVSSLCSLKLLSNCLSKDYIKHEVIFIDDNVDLKVTNRFVYLYHGSSDEEKENEQTSRRRKKFMNYINLEVHNKLINNENRIEFVKEECKCDENNFNCLINMFYLCKSLNYLNEDALWCCLIPFSFYKCHLFLTYEDKKNHEDDDSQSDSFEECELPEDTCNVCLSILSHINFEIKKSENNKQDGLVIAKNLLHPLMLFSDIFSSLKHDIHFVIKNKLLYKKRKDIEEMKIKTFLAHKGISIKFAKELYTNLDHSTKKFLLRNFQIGQQYFLIRRKNLVISAVDMAYILNCTC